MLDVGSFSNLQAMRPISVYTLHLVLFLLLLLKKACFGSGCLDSVELLAQQELGVDRQENRFSQCSVKNEGRVSWISPKDPQIIFKDYQEPSTL
ncbi:hypothetical protein OUZ56_002886 [Daphnia magna]|uniref:Uncharacterized protein n=1 Tax=Daphnia magna TaxID=35525 RepID=A0ABR0A7D9_9CRUS|nr:hypothetical protein OUZ56_002886 [Daphnia magna]